MSEDDIHHPDKQRFVVVTARGYEGDSFVWDSVGKYFEDDFVDWDEKKRRFGVRKRIPIRKVVYYTTVACRENNVDDKNETENEPS